MNRLGVAVAMGILAGCAAGTGDAAEKTVAVTFIGGHETDPRDRGRPVVLVAAGLGVTPEVFREAFSGVTPARGRGPTGEEARRNKEALMKVLKPHGITNDRLDEVSNYYRYRPDRGEMWPTIPAKAHAVIVDGKVTKIVLTEAGAGYSSAPMVEVPGYPEVRATARVKFQKELKRNGSLIAVELVATKKSY